LNLASVYIELDERERDTHSKRDREAKRQRAREIYTKMQRQTDGEREE